MATNQSILQTIQFSNGQTVAGPVGADPAAFRRYAEARIRQAASPKKSTKKQTTRKASKKSNYAKMQSTLAFATVELVERVNRPPTEPEPRFVNGFLRVF